VDNPELAIQFKEKGYLPHNIKVVRDELTGSTKTFGMLEGIERLEFTNPWAKTFGFEQDF